MKRLSLIWKWLRSGENRGALQFSLQYIFGPFSVLGLILGAYYFFTLPPEHSFEVRAEGGDEANQSTGILQLEVINHGRKTIFAPGRVTCWGELLAESQRGISLTLETFDNRQIASGSLSILRYGIRYRHSFFIEDSGAVMISTGANDHYSVLNAQHAQLVNCRANFEPIDTPAFFEFSVSPSGQSTLRFIGMMGSTDHKYP